MGTPRIVQEGASLPVVCLDLVGSVSFEAFAEGEDRVFAVAKGLVEGGDLMVGGADLEI